jgi:hypothetical protein
MNKTFFCWEFYCVNDNALVDFENAQIMCCTFYHEKIMITTNLITQAKKGLISYYKTNGITCL